MNSPEYILITERALDLMLLHRLHDDRGLPKNDNQHGLFRFDLNDQIVGFSAAGDIDEPSFALISITSLESMTSQASDYALDIYRRIARVVKGLHNPPIHLPRQWSEYHHKNLLAFFALPKNASDLRWIAEMNSEHRCVRFKDTASRNALIALQDFVPTPWPSDLSVVMLKLVNSLKTTERSAPTSDHLLAEEVDLQAIGSGSVVRNQTSEEWQAHLSESQKKVLAQPIGDSVRIVGPAGSGKTLTLCLRAIQIARDPSVVSQGKRILIATHSWAMTERIDGILNVLNGGASVDGIITFPLLSLLQMHAGHIGQQKTDVIGDDSTDGRFKAIDILKKIVSAGRPERKGVSQWIMDGLSSSDDSRPRLDLLFNLYEEITGVLTASAVALDDPDAIQSYLNSHREEWMPPFNSIADRGFVVGVYREFLRELIDRTSITTDQFVLDSIRVLETFTWRMRKETDGYDFIFVDELQLFDSQERSALELLGRSRKGVPFTTAEDPSQGVFSTLHSKRRLLDGLESVYLDTVHRFDKGIFDLINFIYQKFPLNTVPLRVDASKNASLKKPYLHLCGSDVDAVEKAKSLIKVIIDKTNSSQNERICLATLGDIDDAICSRLEQERFSVVRLTSFDDVEQLAYSKRSIIVAPWQFIGGTQFSHVIVIAAAMSPAQTAFAKLRELTAVYLACSRAANSLNVICAGYVPAVIREAKDQGFFVDVIE